MSTSTRVAAEATEALNAEVFGQTGFEDGDVAQLNEILARFRAQAGDFEAGDGAESPAGRDR